MHPDRDLFDAEAGPVESQEHICIGVVAGEDFSGKITYNLTVESLISRGGIGNASPDEN